MIPRLTTAHFDEAGALGVYRFLGALQREGLPLGYGWRWGKLESLPFLPRVVRGDVVLSLAQWNLAPSDVTALNATLDQARFEAVQALRDRLALPRWVGVECDDDGLVSPSISTMWSTSNRLRSFSKRARRRGCRRSFRSARSALAQLRKGPKGYS